MKHPTIPPNCPEFKRRAGFFLVEAADEVIREWFIDLDNPPPQWRVLIACRARSAWLDEAERLIPRGTEAGKTTPGWIGSAESLAHADAWAKFGRGEAWE